MRADEQDPFDDDHGATPEELERAMGAAIGTPQGGAPPTASEDTDDLLADIHEVAEALRHPSHARAGTHRGLNWNQLSRLDSSSPSHARAGTHLEWQSARGRFATLARARGDPPEAPSPWTHYPTGGRPSSVWVCAWVCPSVICPPLG